MSRMNKSWVIKLNRNNFGELLVEIESKRRELYDVYWLEPRNKVKLVRLSEELDRLINEYQQGL
ncbi:MAG: aspartyl-phosphate phosphatase Spo0E family protein [Firmicutes bacterium]|nr:aspartyl-phosphate phosphatase Spo0E family protein [Bacillota bacterium]